MVPAMAERSAFRYWREPLCVAAALLYVANNLWLKPLVSDPTAFVHCYLGDVLCLPVCVPVTLWLQRRCGLRSDDRQPTARELLLHWLLWSACFEWLGPRLPFLAPGAVSDPWDTVAYAAGGLLAACVWRPEPQERTAGWERLESSIGKLLGRFALAILVATLVLSAYH